MLSVAMPKIMNLSNPLITGACQWINFFMRFVVTSYSHLWPMIRTLLVLSHGQASEELGFSCNMEILETNMQQESLVAKRIVKDFIRSICGLQKFDISPELLKSCSLAYSRYHSALAMKKEKKEEGHRGENQ